MPTMGAIIVRITIPRGNNELYHYITLFFVILGRLNNSMYESDFVFAGLIVLSALGTLSKIGHIDKKASRYLIWVISFLGLYIFSLSWAYDPVTTRTNFIATFGRFILAVYIFLNLAEADGIKKVAGCFIVAVVANNIFISIVYGPTALLVARETEQATGAGNNNTIGMSSAFALIMCFYLRTKPHLSRFRSVILPAFLIIFVALSGSKKAFIIILFAFGMMYFLSHRNKLGAGIMIFISLLIVVNMVMNVPFLYYALGNRIESLIRGLFSMFGSTNYSAGNLMGTAFNGSDRARMNLILYGLQWIKEKPILGYGMANFIRLYGNIYSKALYAHNNYIEIGVGLGLVGLVVYYSLYIFIIRNSLKNIRRSSHSKLAFTLIMLCSILDFGLVSYLETDFQIIIGIAYCLSVGIGISSESGNEEDRLE